MMGHKICFYEEIWIIIRKLSLLLPLIWSTVHITSWPLVLKVAQKDMKWFCGLLYFW